MAPPHSGLLSRKAVPAGCISMAKSPSAMSMARSELFGRYAVSLRQSARRSSLPAAPGTRIATARAPSYGSHAARRIFGGQAIASRASTRRGQSGGAGCTSTVCNRMGAMSPGRRQAVTASEGLRRAASALHSSLLRSKADKSLHRHEMSRWTSNRHCSHYTSSDELVAPSCWLPKPTPSEVEGAAPIQNGWNRGRQRCIFNPAGEPLGSDHDGMDKPASKRRVDPHSPMNRMKKSMKEWVKQKVEQVAEQNGCMLLQLGVSCLAMANRLRDLFDRLGIKRVIDVGANEGQYGDFLRTEVGFKGLIKSFEPVPEFAESAEGPRG